jgi:hypothetical protein
LTISNANGLSATGIPMTVTSLYTKTHDGVSASIGIRRASHLAKEWLHLHLNLEYSHLYDKVGPRRDEEFAHKINVALDNTLAFTQARIATYT